MFSKFSRRPSGREHNFENFENGGYTTLLNVFQTSAFGHWWWRPSSHRELSPVRKGTHTPTHRDRRYGILDPLDPQISGLPRLAR